MPREDGTHRKGRAESGSIDPAWTAAACDRLFSFEGADGHAYFYSEQEAAIADQRIFGAGKHAPISSYGIFAPDEIVNRISGDISGPGRDDVLTAYIDGSFAQRKSSHDCAYGVFMVCGSKTAEYANSIADDSSRYNSLGGELTAAIVAIKIAIAEGYRAVELRYDCHGVAAFDGGEGMRPNKNGKRYWLFDQYKAFLDCVRDLIDISFSHVKAHSLDMGNEHANYLASTWGARTLLHRVMLESGSKRIRGSEVSTLVGNPYTIDTGIPIDLDALSDVAQEPPRDGVEARPTVSDEKADRPRTKRARDVADAEFRSAFSIRTDEDRAALAVSEQRVRKLSSSIGGPDSLEAFERAFVDASEEIAHEFDLSDDEMSYLRLICAGAHGNTVLSHKMCKSKAAVKEIRKRTCKRLECGMAGGDNDPQKALYLYLFAEG